MMFTRDMYIITHIVMNTYQTKHCGLGVARLRGL